MRGWFCVKSEGVILRSLLQPYALVAPRFVERRSTPSRWVTNLSRSRKQRVATRSGCDTPNTRKLGKLGKLGEKNSFFNLGKLGRLSKNGLYRARPV